MSRSIASHSVLEDGKNNTGMTTPTATAVTSIGTTASSGQVAIEKASKTTRREPKLTMVLIPMWPLQWPASRWNRSPHRGQVRFMENQWSNSPPDPQTGQRRNTPHAIRRAGETDDAVGVSSRACGMRGERTDRAPIRRSHAAFD